MRRFCNSLQRSQELAARLMDAGVDAPLSASDDLPRSLDYAQCLEFAIGSIGDVLGPEFAEIDAYPTRVRLPDEPLMLCDRILAIEGEPLSLTQRPGGHRARHPAATAGISTAAGSRPASPSSRGRPTCSSPGYLGIDFVTRGLAVYRLLDAVVTFHRAAGPGRGDPLRHPDQPTSSARARRTCSASSSRRPWTASRC